MPMPLGPISQDRSRVQNEQSDDCRIRQVKQLQTSRDAVRGPAGPLQKVKMADLEQPIASESPLAEASPTLQTKPDLAPGGDEGGHEYPPEADDGVEIEFEGDKYKVPPKLKDAFFAQKDYTQKTQELADQRRALEATQQEFVQRQQFQQQYLDAVADVRSIDRELAKYQKLDWNSLYNTDPAQAARLNHQKLELQEQRTNLVGGIQQAMQTMESKSVQETTRRLSEAQAQLARDIPGYSTPEVQKGLMEVGKALGYKPEELANVNDPRAVKVLHEAYLYRQLSAKMKAEAGKPEPEFKPISRVAPGNTPSKKSLLSMNQSEFNRAREQQIKNRH